MMKHYLILVILLLAHAIEECHPLCPHGYRDPQIVGNMATILNLISNLNDPTCEPKCPKGFSYLFRPMKSSLDYVGSCYKFYPTKLKVRENAKQMCQRLGAELTGLETVEEMGHIKNTLRENDKLYVRVPGRNNVWRGYWTSGTDREEEGVWIWESTGTKFEYDNWVPDEPNNISDEDFMYISMSKFQWVDMKPNYFPHAVFCEKNATCD